MQIKKKKVSHGQIPSMVFLQYFCSLAKQGVIFCLFVCFSGGTVYVWNFNQTTGNKFKQHQLLAFLQSSREVEFIVQTLNESTFFPFTKDVFVKENHCRYFFYIIPFIIQPRFANILSFSQHLAWVGNQEYSRCC